MKKPTGIFDATSRSNNGLIVHPGDSNDGMLAMGVPYPDFSSPLLPYFFRSDLMSS